MCNNPVDMVFLADTMCPVNGFRLMQVLRKNVPKLVVVMLSNDEQNRMDAIRAGADDYLLKPISPHMLGGLVNQLVV
ncbi:MAG: response regulator [Oscillospiraceae bacterium]